MKPYKINPTQFNALLIIRDYQKQGILQKELARRLLINAASTGTLIDHLEKMQLLKRVAVAVDRRAYHLNLTTQGLELLKKILPGYYELLDEVFQFPAGQQQQCLEIFDKLRQRVR